MTCPSDETPQHPPIHPDSAEKVAVGYTLAKIAASITVGIVVFLIARWILR